LTDNRGNHLIAITYIERELHYILNITLYLNI